MPQNIAEFRIIGRVGRITKREKVTYVNVAANYNRRDGDDWKQDTLWNSVVCFSNLEAVMDLEVCLIHPVLDEHLPQAISVRCQR